MYKKTLSAGSVAGLLLVLFFSLFSNIVLAQDDEVLDAALMGETKFAPGTTNTIYVVIQNNMTLGEKGLTAVQEGILDYWASAASLRATLKSGDAPVIVNTDKVLLGSLHSGAVTHPIPFEIEINENAEPGIYYLKLELSYNNLFDITTGEVGKRLYWIIRESTKDLRIEIIEKQTSFVVTEVKSNLYPGKEGEIRLTFKNNGSQIARGSVAKISTAGGALSLTDDIAYLGDISPGDSAVGIFGIKARGNAIPKTYDLTAQVKYTDFSGEEHLSELIKAPVEVFPTSSIIKIFDNPLVAALAGAAIVAIIWIIWFVLFRTKPIEIHSDEKAEMK